MLREEGDAILSWWEETYSLASFFRLIGSWVWQFLPYFIRYFPVPVQDRRSFIINFLGLKGKNLQPELYSIEKKINLPVWNWSRPYDNVCDNKSKLHNRQLVTFPLSISCHSELLDYQANLRYCSNKISFTNFTLLIRTISTCVERQHFQNRLFQDRCLHWRFFTIAEKDGNRLKKRFWTDFSSRAT